MVLRPFSAAKYDKWGKILLLILYHGMGKRAICLGEIVEKYFMFHVKHGLFGMA